MRQRSDGYFHCGIDNHEHATNEGAFHCAQEQIANAIDPIPQQKPIHDATMEDISDEKKEN